MLTLAYLCHPKSSCFCVSVFFCFFCHPKSSYMGDRHGGGSGVGRVGMWGTGRWMAFRLHITARKKTAHQTKQTKTTILRVSIYIKMDTPSSHRDPKPQNSRLQICKATLPSLPPTRFFGPDRVEPPLLTRAPVTVAPSTAGARSISIAAGIAGQSTSLSGRVRSRIGRYTIAKASRSGASGLRGWPWSKGRWGGGQEGRGAGRGAGFFCHLHFSHS